MHKNNGNPPQELQSIREQRLLEWHAKQQTMQNTSLDQQYYDSTFQNIPEAEHLFSAANNGNVAQIRQLLAQGLDINVSNNERETALHMASARGHYPTVVYLIKQGAYVNAPTVKNWIPLHHAVRFRHPNIANYLIRHGSSAHARTSDGLSSVDMASNVHDYQMLSILRTQ